MQLTGLNDDVLVHVFSYLHGKDALSVALASRRFHYLAVPRVSAVIQCRNYLVLPRLWSYLVATSPPRARHISHLEVDFPGMRSLSELHLKITHPLTDILTQARNIRVLFLYGFFLADLDMDSYTAFAGALHAMSSLSELSITFLHDDNLPALCASLPSSLRALSLGYISAWENKKHSYPPLLRVLTSLQNMCSLHLRGFKPRAGLGDMSPTFPSLLILTFYDVSLPAVDLISLAPNLQQVSVECEHTKQSQWFPHIEPWTESPRPWPPVRRIEFNVMSSLTHFRDAFSSTADHLKITARTAPTRAGELLSILRVLSPLGADLYLTIGDDPAVFWREVADAAPRLRYLRLSLTVKSSAGSWTPWMNDLAASLSVIPLVYLKVRPHLKFYKTDFNTDTALGPKKKLKQQDLAVLETELTRTVVCEASARLPQLLADAMPTLRFFELGVPGETSDANAGYACDEDADTSRWWRITSGRPEEMSAEEGQRVLARDENAGAGKIYAI